MLQNLKASEKGMTAVAKGAIHIIDEGIITSGDINIESNNLTTNSFITVNFGYTHKK